MMIIISFMGGSNESLTHIIPELLIGVVLIALFVWVSRHPDFKVPCAVRIRKDHDLRIFAALVICLGLAFLTSFFGLSASLGAFIAGILVANGKETKWVENSLHSFHILFVAIFFVSIGMLIDISFVLEHLAVILGAVFLVFFINTFVKGIVLKLLGDTWSESFYSGALLSQIGEFSFVLGAAALHTGIITLVGYQYVIAIISISLVLSPFWIQIFKKNMDVVERLHGSMYRW